LICKLVTTGHLNVPERLQLRSKSIPIREILKIIEDVLNEQNFFPPHARPGNSAKGVYEGGILEKLNDGTYRLHWQRHYAWDPFTVAESSFQDYKKLEIAVREFGHHEWRENDIDGIKITWNWLDNFKLASAPVVRWLFFQAASHRDGAIH